MMMGTKWKGNEINVQGTNDSSIVSKCSMAALGYFEDRFLENFVQKKARRAPLINRGYYVRAKAMDFAIQMFLQKYKKQTKQIISLGAGFDSSYFRLRDQGALCNTRYLELDFPEVVQRKIKLINAREALSGHIEKTGILNNEIITKDYSVIGCDLTNLSRLDTVLESVKFSNVSHTLLFSEVVLTYVDKESCSRLIEWAANKFQNSVFLLYEQIQPHDAFGIVMQKHFKTLQSPLRCIQDYPTLESQVCRFRALGWERCRAFDMNQFYYKIISKEERDRVEKIEMFDEFEEWHLKCSHYALVAAFSGNCCSLQQQLFPDYEERRREDREMNSTLSLPRKHEDEERFKRFGHQLVKLANGSLFVSGGFGCKDSKHQRLRDGVIFSLPPGEEEIDMISSFPLFERSKMFHTLTALRYGLVFVFGGRESPAKPCLDYGILRIVDKEKPVTNHEVKDTDQVRYPEFHWEGRLNPDTAMVCRKAEMTEVKVREGEIREDGAQEDTSQPICRWRHSATTVYIKGEEYVLIFGGRNEKTLALSDCWLFQTSTCKWKQVHLQTDYNIVIARHSHAVCDWGGGKIIISGGLDVQSRPMNLIQIMHFVTEDEIHLSTVDLESTFPARYSHTSHGIGNELWLVGGVSLDIFSNFVVVNLKSLTWTEYRLKEQDSILSPLMLHNHSSVCNGKEILVIGGGGNCFSFGTHFNRGVVLIELPKYVIS